ncbi:MAG TPA: CDP-alcohol phosphatidyltransferase family protein [Acidobacteriota bacterium]|nr:CDP-alcohol phosphatidyltransferase family protein [Acidobacteriota bacterium]
MISEGIGRGGTAVKGAIAAVIGGLGIPPNVLTLSSLIPMMIAAWNLAQGRPFAAAGWIVLGGLLDLIDGAVARAYGTTTEFGGVLDSVVDRASDTLVHIGVVYHFHTLDEPLFVVLSAVSLGGSLGVSYTRARAENVIPECRVGFTERGERLVLLMLGLFAGRLAQAVTLLAFLAWLTTVQRLLHAYRILRKRHRDSADDTQLPRGLEVWGPTGRWLFLNWPRGSWQYDLICAAIIAALLVLPGV